MIWRKVQSYQTEKPNRFDKSNLTVVYVRKNIYKTKDKENNDVWEYEEQIVPKRDWEIYEDLFCIDELIDNLNNDIWDVLLEQEVKIACVELGISVEDIEGED